jgi:hypothetical protein
MRFRPTPSTLLAGAALFFALGGSAVAVSDAVRPQPRCANGAVRGIADVTGEPGKGMANVPDQFSGTRALFARTFNCGGGGTQVRRAGFGVYEVRFPGNAAPSALVASSAAQATVQAVGGGVFRVTLRVPGRDDEIDTPFVVILV